MIMRVYKKLPVWVRRYTSRLARAILAVEEHGAAPDASVPEEVLPPVPVVEPRAPKRVRIGGRQFQGDHIAVVGVFSNRSGLSRAAELVSITLEERGHKVTRVDVWPSFGFPPYTTVPPNCVSPEECQLMDVSDLVSVTNPGTPTLDVFDAEWLGSVTVIGHWIWEVDVLPDYWTEESRFFDELWAATSILAETLKINIKNSIKIDVVPYAVDSVPFQKVDEVRRTAVRRQQGVKISHFVAGYSFSVASNYYRKNPEAAVHAFKEAFPHDPNVMLFLRCNDLSTRPLEKDRLVKAIGSDARVRVYDGDNYISMEDFYAAIDVYLSSSRAEGYGLNLVEASQSGLPVITSSWRIPSEISSRERVVGVEYDLVRIDDPQGNYSDLRMAYWSQPSIRSMAESLRYVRRTPWKRDVSTAADSVA